MERGYFRGDLDWEGDFDDGESGRKKGCGIDGGGGNAGLRDGG